MNLNLIHKVDDEIVMNIELKMPLFRILIKILYLTFRNIKKITYNDKSIIKINKSNFFIIV